MRLHYVILLSVGLALALFVAVGGSDNNNLASANSPQIVCPAQSSLRGGGSTFVQNLAQQWIKQYLRACPVASLDYQGIGSGAGVQQFTAGTIDLAGSDVRLTSSELQKAQQKWGPVLQIPWAAGAIAVLYNVDGLPNVQLSPTTLAGIFSGTIKRWNSPELTADNPGVHLPNLAIQVVHRSDGSGTTAAFTAFMTATAPQVWTAGTSKDVKWPVGQGAKGSDGVTALVKSQQGTIAYAEVSYAKLNTLGIARVQNAAGNFSAPDAVNVSASLSDAAIDKDFNVTMNYGSVSPHAYPITTVTYAIVPKKFSDAGKGELAKSFLSYAIGDGQHEAEPLFYTPLPPQIVTANKQAVASIGAGS